MDYVRTRVVPREKLGEEGVVVGQRLAGSSRVGWGLTRGSEIGELGRGLLVLVLDLVGDGACRRCVTMVLVMAARRRSMARDRAYRKRQSRRRSGHLGAGVG